jgi:hypothetical protein
MADSMCTLVLGDRHKSEIKKLISVLDKYFSLVLTTLNVTGDEMLYLSPAPSLVVFTDTLYCATEAPARIRNHLPKAGFVALFDHVEPETETALRCAGTLFLGSYETFYTFSQAVVAPLLSGRCR